MVQNIGREKPSYYAGDELHAVKQAKIQQALEDHKLEGIVLIKPEAVRYATDFYVKGYRPFCEPEYLAFIPRGRKAVVGYTSGSDQYRIQIRSDIEDHRKLPGIENWAKELITILRDYKVTTGRIGADLLPFNLQQAILNELPDLEFVDLADIWNDLTVVKHPVEIECLRKAVEITEIGLQAALTCIRAGVREYEVAAWAEYAMRKNGSEMTPFITNVASGVNSAIFERISTDKIIREGEMVILDLGCVWKGYTGDLGRTVCMGEPTREQKNIYRVTYLALQEAINAVRPGATCGEIDAAARSVIKDEGYEKYEHKFATGHQLGYGLHGSPSINRNVKDILRPGMIIAIEPRVTIYDNPAIGGAHLEDVVLVTETGCEKISKLGYDKNLLSN
ncbi:M24 family metallopeptidase [Sporomusa acidovorans]|uniref:Methionine aminopeptidase 1, mitochondrial n=1 Tax=Sporomusa acidovorans (strain ATCC 49682 / DSM 3132 / Mol) TaxID=1123286 RepID=A0ABZ3IWS2_SPOA4|nr:Xaa-Pro peptidase family protein [Sporomusa acidovorans]OZC13978.1 aminopeptidase YpdF [Sporomusa acidovorans DSM 3132]SDF21657.1 Creatinase/Prolidase N-terminal domain-containing protein [Sporomusa acidovorans]